MWKLLWLTINRLQHYNEMNDNRLTLRPHAAGFGKHGPRILLGHPLTLAVKVSKMPRMTTMTVTIPKVLSGSNLDWTGHLLLITFIWLTTLSILCNAQLHMLMLIYMGQMYILSQNLLGLSLFTPNHFVSHAQSLTYYMYVYVYVYNWLTPPGHFTNKIYLQKIHIYQSTWATGPQQEIDCKYDAIKTSCRFCPFRGGSRPHIHYIERYWILIYKYI